MLSRRQFLNKLSQVAVVAGATAIFPRRLSAEAFLTEEAKLHKLVILHTNDVHSRIEPFPLDGGKNQGLGGVARRAALLQKIRSEEKNVLLLDAGDMFQGTPYFNYFKGELEIKLMSELGYDAATIGNHDFDAGLENLQKQIANHASFPLVNCNYDFSDTVMKGHTVPYKIFVKNGIKIGVLGVGVQPEGLIPKPLYGDTRYIDPLGQANATAAVLRNDEHCDYVICLSHLGYKYDNMQVSDLALAALSQDIDLIIGGHTHTLLDTPTVVKNKADNEVLVSQAYWAGIVLGRIDVYFEKSLSKKCVECKNTVVTGE